MDRDDEAHARGKWRGMLLAAWALAAAGVYFSIYFFNMAVHWLKLPALFAGSAGAD